MHNNLQLHIGVKSANPCSFTISKCWKPIHLNLAQLQALTGQPRSSNLGQKFIHLRWILTIWHLVRLKEMTICWPNHPLKSYVFILLQFIPMDLVVPIVVMHLRCVHYNYKCESGGLDSVTKPCATLIYIKPGKYPSC